MGRRFSIAAAHDFFSRIEKCELKKETPFFHLYLFFDIVSVVANIVANI